MERGQPVRERSPESRSRIPRVNPVENQHAVRRVTFCYESYAGDDEISLNSGQRPQASDLRIQERRLRLRRPFEENPLVLRLHLSRIRNAATTDWRGAQNDASKCPFGDLADVFR